MFAIWHNDRPAWSVCGEDLCLCVKPAEQTPSCPLCITDDDTDSCSSDESQTKNHPERRVPRNPHTDAISQAGHFGCASIFIAFAFGYAPMQPAIEDALQVRFIEPDARLALNSPDIPTPPPRS